VISAEIEANGEKLCTAIGSRYGRRMRKWRDQHTCRRNEPETLQSVAAVGEDEEEEEEDDDDDNDDLGDELAPIRLHIC